jgi:hypothetical protein
MAPQAIEHGALMAQARSVRSSFLSNAFSRAGYMNNYHWGAGYPYYPYRSFGYAPYGWGLGGWGLGGWGFGYPWRWYVPGWSAATFWTFAGLSTLANFLGMESLIDTAVPPMSSSVVIYEGDNVYVNSQPYGSSQDYYEQAKQLALTGKQPLGQVQDYGPSAGTSTSQAQPWQPLGVFALARSGQTDSDMILQLAINKDGIVHGNYFNQLTNESLEVQGAIDKKTQRISWTIGDNPKTVFDAGLGDLIKSESTVLVHYGPEATTRMSLLRLQQPPSSPAPAQNEDQL